MCKYPGRTWFPPFTPSRLTHKWGPVETMLFFNFKSRTSLIKHPKTNCRHLYVLVCVLTHPVRQQVCTCACLIYGLILRTGSFLHHFWFNDAGISVNKSKNCVLDSFVLDIDASFCLPSCVHWCILSHILTQTLCGRRLLLLHLSQPRLSFTVARETFVYLPLCCRRHKLVDFLSS